MARSSAAAALPPVAEFGHIRSRRRGAAASSGVGRRSERDARPVVRIPTSERSRRCRAGCPHHLAAVRRRRCTRPLGRPDVRRYTSSGRRLEPPCLRAGTAVLSPAPGSRWRGWSRPTRRSKGHRLPPRRERRSARLSREIAGGQEAGPVRRHCKWSRNRRSTPRPTRRTCRPPDAGAAAAARHRDRTPNARN